MNTYYFAPVYGPKDQLVRYAGVTVEETPPEMRERKPEKGKRLEPVTTGRNAAFAAINLKTAVGRCAHERTRPTAGCAAPVGAAQGDSPFR